MRQALWDVGTGTVIANVYLPGNPPGLDARGTAAVDDGPTPYTAGQLSPDGSCNVLDWTGLDWAGLTMTDWDVGEFFSFK